MDLQDEMARQRLLEDWAAARLPKHPGPDGGQTLTRRSKLRLRWAVRALRVRNRILDRANRILDRDLHTRQELTEPEHDHPDRISYVPSDWHVLPRALRYIGVSETDVFADFGCGRGRIVHQAAKRPFRRVIGIEISSALAESAEALVAAHRHQHRCRDVEILVADAVDYRVPDDVTVAYLFDPFHDATFAAVLGNIVDSLDRNPRKLRLIYCYPSQGAQVLATGKFRLLKEQRSWLLDTHLSRTQIFESV